MKILIVLLGIACISEALLTEPRLAENWNSFKKSHGKRFSNSREERFRKGIFNKKVHHIEEHNERYRQGMESYEIGINQFTDYTEEELMPYTHGLQLPLQLPEPLITITSNHSFSRRSALSAVPSSFDWRNKSAVTPVKNQGSCGSCWAFSTNGAIESHYKIHYGSAVTLSEQQLVDCVTTYNGCNGGFMYGSYKYIAGNGGINYDGDYPYEAKEGSCRYESSEPHISIKGYASLAGADEEKLKDMVATQGPVAVAIDAGGDFAGYSSGVYYNPSCSTSSFTHAVLIVGYGNENGQDYWLVKNSWGTWWGQNGYIKMARNRGNHCGIATYASYPVF